MRFTPERASTVTRRAPASASSSRRFGSRHLGASPRYESQTRALDSRASWQAASTPASPPPTTSTAQSAYCSGSMSRYTTFGSSSPGTPSLRGEPRRPTASTTLRARTGPRVVWTVKSPSRPSIPTTFTPSSTARPARRMIFWNEASRSSLEMRAFPNVPPRGSSTFSVITTLRRG